MNENTAPVENSTQLEAATKLPSSFVHAVLKNKVDGTVKILKTKTRTELAKALASDVDAEIVAVFKGKQLNIREKKSFNFS